MEPIGKGPPKKGSAAWKRNEKIIAENPVLRGLREQSQGHSASGSTSTGSWVPSEEYKANWDSIFNKKGLKADD